MQDAYDVIDAIPPDGNPLVLSFDYDPASAAELTPMAEAVLRHCFAKRIRVLGISLQYSGQGAGIAAEVMPRIAREFGREQNIDWAFLGFQPNAVVAMLQMGEDIKKTFPTDYYGTPVDKIPLMENIQNYDQVPAVLTLAGTAVGEYWAIYPGMRYGVTVLAGLTAVYCRRHPSLLPERPDQGDPRRAQGGGRVREARGPPGERHRRDAFPEGRPLHDHPLHRPGEHRLPRHPGEEPLMDATAGSVAWTLVGGLVTLAIFSFLYKDNPLYKLAEHLAVGISVGFLIVNYYYTVFMPKVWDNVLHKGQFDYLIPLHPRRAPLHPLRARSGAGSAAGRWPSSSGRARA